MTAGAATPTETFEAERPRLTGLAYRMLDTLADAEDVVQDVWLRWQSAPPGEVERPEAWLTTVTTRVALDHLRRAHRRREAYVGPWLPEPLVPDADHADPAEAAELADSLRIGFLAVLDGLAPIDRAVFLLADVFGVPFGEIASTVGKSEAACRQIASRARRRVRIAAPVTPSAADRSRVDSFIVALAAGDVDRVLECVAPDVVCVSDGGPSKRAARRPVVGADRVARLLVNLARRSPPEAEVRAASVGGDTGVIVSIAGEIELVMACEVVEDRITTVRIVRNPDKLAHVGAVPPLT